MARKHDDLPGQRRAPLSRGERLELIDGVDLAKAGIAPRMWRSIRALLQQIEFCSSGAESRVRIDTLAARMAVYRTTVMRAAAAAEAAGLLLVDREQYDAAGRASNGWRIRWDRMLAVQADPGGAAAGATHRVRGATHRVRGATHRVRGATHPIKGIRSSNVQEEVHTRSSDDAGEKPDDQKDLGKQDAEGRAGGAGRAGSLSPASSGAADPLGDPIDAATARGVAELVERRVGPCRQRGDWDLAVKAAILSRRFGEQWLWGSVEGTVRRRENRALGRLKNPWSYFTRLLQEATRKQGRTLNRELAKITLPPELRLPTRPDPDQAPMSARMCVGGEL